ncbi:MAG: Ig-like domain-containing domain [Flavihumibacter sp.]|nr:Ig-like domain-containing domain [Flavihumibacter sp.]
MVQDARKSVKFAPSMEANFTRSPKKIPQKAAGSLLLFLAVLFLITLAESCANIIPPLGGPKDTIPPIPVLLQPKDSTLNFKGNRIVFTFNEYVNLDQIQQNLLVSPTPKINPTVESRLRTVSVRLRDTLEPNTTYTLNFGKQTGKHDSTMIVLLHRNLDDSAVVKERPRYYTKVDSAGNFHFHNLAPGSYNLFALKNEGVPQYGDPTQLFAFYGQTLVLNEQKRESIQLYAYAEPAPPQKPKKPAAPTNKRKEKEEEQDRRLRFGHPGIELPGFPEKLRQFQTDSDG